MITEEKLEKFLSCLDRLIEELTKNNKLPIHSNINQFYYMQKMEELKILKEQLNDAVKRLKFVTGNVENEYTKIFCRWQKDVRWLHKYHLASGEPIL